MISYSDFKNKSLGKLLTDPWGTYKGECVSLVKQYIYQNGWPMKAGNAIQWRNNGDSFYQWIPQTPSGIPHQGDFLVLNIGKYGHIGIVDHADINNVWILNQNYPKGNNTDPVQVTKFNYSKVVGWLRPKGLQNMKFVEVHRFNNSATIYGVVAFDTMDEVNATGLPINLMGPPSLIKEYNNPEVSIKYAIPTFDSVKYLGLTPEKNLKEDTRSNDIKNLNAQIHNLTVANAAEIGSLNKQITVLNADKKELQDELDLEKNLHDDTANTSKEIIAEYEAKIADMQKRLDNLNTRGAQNTPVLQKVVDFIYTLFTKK